MSNDRSLQARNQREWLEARQTTQELIAAEEEARENVAKAINHLIQVSINRASAEHDEDIKSRKMLGEKPAVQ